MDFKNTYIVGTVRTLIALLMFFAAISGYFTVQKMLAGETIPGVTEEQVENSKVLWNTGLLQLVKGMELVIGVMLILNLLPALAATFLAPLSVGFLVVNLMDFNSFGFTLSALIGLANAYFGYVYWDKYKALFAR